MVAPPDPASERGQPECRRVLPPTRRQHGDVLRLETPLPRGTTSLPPVPERPSARPMPEANGASTPAFLPVSILNAGAAGVPVHRPRVLGRSGDVDYADRDVRSTQGEARLQPAGSWAFDSARRFSRRRFRARAAASASSRRYCRKCSGCAAIQTSGKSDLRSTSAEDRAISN